MANHLFTKNIASLRGKREGRWDGGKTWRWVREEGQANLAFPRGDRVGWLSQGPLTGSVVSPLELSLVQLRVPVRRDHSCPHHGIPRTNRKKRWARINFDKSLLPLTFQQRGIGLKTIYDYIENNLDLNEEVSEMLLKCRNILIQREETFNQYTHLLSKTNEIKAIICMFSVFFPGNTNIT